MSRRICLGSRKARAKSCGRYATAAYSDRGADIVMQSSWYWNQPAKLEVADPDLPLVNPANALRRCVERRTGQ